MNPIVGTTIVCVVLVGIVAFIVYRMIAKKKKGKSPLCGDCEHCGGHCNCK